MGMATGIKSLSWSLVVVGALLIAVVSAGDEAALLAFREQISGSGALASWNSSAGFCSWEGVTCSHWTPKRAVALRLDGRALVGALSPALGNLTFLRTLNLSFNWFHREIPASLGRLRRLQRLDLSDNSSSGTFHVNLSSCISMTEMRLRNNKLGGHIPAELGDRLASLEVVSLRNNSFTGPIPASLANLSYLQNLDLGLNQLVGSIPPGLGTLHSEQGTGKGELTKPDKGERYVGSRILVRSDAACWEDGETVGVGMGRSGETVCGGRSRSSEETWAAAGEAGAGRGRDVVEEVSEELDHAGMGAGRGPIGPAVRVAGARAGHGGCELH